MTKTRIVLLLSVGLALLVAAPASSSWREAGFLRQARKLHTATLLTSGQVLVAGGAAEGGSSGASTALANSELVDPLTGRSTPTGSLITARRVHTATRLPSGKVLVVGGYKPGNTFSDNTELASGELYDPTTGTWTPTGSLLTPRAFHTATLLPSGKVLVAGGKRGFDRLASAELYDPVTGIWTALPDMWAPHEEHTATLLRSGKVLIVGGWPDGRSVELYDPVTEQWLPTGSLGVVRALHTATLLPSGKVLAVGGYTSSAEVYDPATGIWQDVGSMPQVRSKHTAALLPSGQVLVAGGSYGGFFGIESAEVFNPDTGTWLAAGFLRFGLMDHTATVLPDGGVLLSGGFNGFEDLSALQVYRPDGGTWRWAGFPAYRQRPDTIILRDGRVLAVAGGYAGAEIFDPANESWSVTGSPAVIRFAAATTLLPSGGVLLAGGYSNEVHSSAEVWNPSTGQWEPTNAMNFKRSGATATLLPSGKVLVVGGGAREAELYDPATGTWKTAGSLEVSRTGHAATLLLSGKVLVTGGTDGRTILESAELYDPEADTWWPTGPLLGPRKVHTATLLPSGSVLVAGGWMPASTTAEIYDPKTESWKTTGSLTLSRIQHGATLLLSGRVLVAGGGFSDDARAEIYDPVTGSWEVTGALGQNRFVHGTTALPSGEVLVIGGHWSSYDLASAELYTPPGTPPAGRRPVVFAMSSAIEYGHPLTVTGIGFRGDSEASDGTTHASAADIPFVLLRSLDGTRQVWLTPDPRPAGTAEPGTLNISRLPPSLNPGPYLLSVSVAGVPSEPRRIDVLCSLALTLQPESRTAPLGSTVTFSVETQGGRWFQWRRDGVDIPGANASSYTTPPIGPGDSGTVYSVVVGSGCTHLDSAQATLTVADANPPEAAVISPAGGEYWILSSLGAPNSEVVSWAMSDDIRVCRVEVRLIASNDGGATYAPVTGGGLLLAAGPGGACRFGKQPDTSSLLWDVPVEPPSGLAGSLYKIEVLVTDHAGLVTTARSPNPFFIVQSNPDSVRTLILVHLPRMQAQQGISQVQAEGLVARLRDLAGHPRVQGLVVDLDRVTRLTDFYQAWDAAPSDPDRANAVLFGAGALREYLRSELLSVYTGVRYLVIVGDDRIVPMARMPDRTGLRESAYVQGGDLTATGTTVGRALAADRYLTDDLLVAPGPLSLPLTTEQRERGTFLPEFGIGRLVETPDEIAMTIATFISRDGVLDLAALDSQTDRKVLVTGYDFLLDAGRRIRDQWSQALSLPPEDDATTPVDGRLLTPTWGEATVPDRRAALHRALTGEGTGRPAVSSLNGHATHFLEGVPGTMATDIQGLPAGEIYGPHACGAAPAMDLAGALIYGLGCHGGLPVAGSCATDADHSLDLPQTFLARGVAAYIANTGYGWGLLEGVGYGERLVGAFTGELTAGGTVVVGEAIWRAKLRYFLELPRFDDYDEKTLLQWTLFGLPMYAVRTGIATASSPAGAPLGKLPENERESLGAVVVKRGIGTTAKNGGSPPPYLTRLALYFDLSAVGIYTKYRAGGRPVAEGITGCPTPPPGEPAGCYYELNGVSGGDTGTADLPIQPYLVYDSRLAGTSQHGALWLGGDYEEEGGWVPVVAQLASNGGDFSNHGTTPRLVKPRPHVRHRPTGDDPICRPDDLETSSLVVVTGESLRERESDPAPTRQRIYHTMDLEVFYFNDQGRGGNCDRTGPIFASGPFTGAYHRASGATVEWAVPVSDEADVWRVVVVYDFGPDASGRSSWRPIELSDDGGGVWRGQISAVGTARLTYLLQAVDRRGNVSWLEGPTGPSPASGVPHGLPLPVDVSVGGSADLAVSLADHPDPIAAGGLLISEVAVENRGPDDATQATVIGELPPGATYIGWGGGWTCSLMGEMATCTLPALPVGPAPSLRLFIAPGVDGTLTHRVRIAALESDLMPSNSETVEQTFVIAGADLGVSKSDGGAKAVPGQPLTYTVAAFNRGPQSVTGAVVRDLFPASLQEVVWTCVATPGSACTPNGSGNIIDTVNLLSGGTVIYTATGRVAAGILGILENTATITLPVGMPDPRLNDNTAVVSTPLPQIFKDGFESGGATSWSATEPPLAEAAGTEDGEPTTASAPPP